MSKRKEGWWKQLHLRRYHYFAEGRSLCGRRELGRGHDFPKDEPPLDKQCVACRRIVESGKKIVEFARKMGL